MIEAYSEQLITIDELRTRMPHLRARETSLRGQIDALDAQTADRDAYLTLADDLEGFLAQLHGNAATATVQDRQRVLRLLVKDILIGPEKITIRHRIPTHPDRSGARQRDPGPDTEGDHRPGYLLRWGRGYQVLRVIKDMSHTANHEAMDQARARGLLTHGSIGSIDLDLGWVRGNRPTRHEPPDPHDGPGGRAPMATPTTVSASRRMGCCHACWGLTAATTMITAVVIPAVTASPGRPSSMTARALAPTSAPGPGVEGQEGQVDQAQNEAHDGGRHPADRGGHALAEAVAQDEDRGQHGPHAAEEIVVPGDGVHVGQSARGQLVGDQARHRENGALHDGGAGLRPGKRTAAWTAAARAASRGSERGHSASSSRSLVLVSSMSSDPSPDSTVLVAYRVKPLICP